MELDMELGPEGLGDALSSSTPSAGRLRYP